MDTPDGVGSGGRGAPDVDPRLHEVLGDAYGLDREVGRGGMARVYRARDRKHDRWVALKVLDADLAQTLGPERFRREIRLAARLQHPHILPVFDSGEAAGRLWFTMPLVAGESLRHRLERERQLPVVVAVRITREVALALDYAHRQGVVHRDVTPANILLTEDGQTLLADFGVARAAEASGAGGALTGTGFSIGTPTYMSPEQGAGERDLDGRSDQYALACVLYEMLAGEPPFTGPTPQAVIAKRFAGPAPDVAVLRDGVAPGVRAALARALGRSPADRFPTAAAFEAALADADPGATPPPILAAVALVPAAPRGGHRVAVAAGIGLAALALAVTIVDWRTRDGRPLATPASAASTPDGGARVVSRQLTFTGTAEEPSFSPDGRQIAYVETECDSTAEGDGCTAALRLQDFGSAQSAVLATGARILHPFWTADGAWVLVLMQPTGAEMGTYIVPRLGGAPRRLGPGALVAFSATGDTILLAALAAPGAPRYVRRVRAATGETLDSTPLARDLTDLQGLLPSPDGRWIVLRLADRLLLATPERRIVDSLVFRNAGSLRWDPRGDALYAVVPGAGTTASLMRAQVDGGRGRFAGPVETVRNLGPAAGMTFDIAPDGRTLVHTGGSVTITLWALDLNARPAAPRRLVARTGWLGTPFISSDGRLVGYDATDQAGDNVYVMDFAGGPGRAVTHETGERYTSGWVPGGHRLTYSGTDPQSPLYAQEVPDGARVVLGRAAASALGDGGTVELDAPGHRLVFRTADGTARAVAIPDSLGGFVRLWDTDADGSGVYLQVPNVAAGALPRIRVVRLDRASEALSVVIDLPMQQVPVPLAAQNLAAQNGAVVYATWPQRGEIGRPTVWRVRPGQSPAKVVELPLQCVQEALTMSADRRRFACAEWTRRPDLFLVEHFDRYHR